MKTKQKVLSNIILYCFTLVFNGVSAFGLINNLSQKDVSAMYPTVITPAGYAFSIWGLIYVLVFICLFKLLKNYKNECCTRVIEATWIWINLSAILNILWIVCFAYLQLILSSVMILCLLFSLFMIIYSINKLSLMKPIVAIAFGIYTGWVLIASFVNILATLQQINPNTINLNLSLLIPLLIILPIICAILIVRSTTNAMVPLPIAWAYIAIYVEHSISDALLGVLFLVVLSLYQLSKNCYKIEICR